MKLAWRFAWIQMFVLVPREIFNTQMWNTWRAGWKPPEAFCGGRNLKKKKSDGSKTAKENQPQSHFQNSSSANLERCATSPSFQHQHLLISFLWSGKRGKPHEEIQRNKNKININLDKTKLKWNLDENLFEQKKTICRFSFNPPKQPPVMASKKDELQSTHRMINTPNNL